MDEPSRTYIFKAAVYNSTSTVPFTLKFEGIGAGAQAELTVLTGTRPQAFNAPRTPEVVRRSLSNITAGDGGSFQFSLPGLSVAVLRARLS